mmetsp:Transcript_5332/g.21524  ORF Transcript_5332/g.21524 Transcript_5332/m.21524 type:complete len:287 (+) Transcript_5332:1515-2375(+)
MTSSLFPQKTHSRHPIPVSSTAAMALSTAWPNPRVPATDDRGATPNAGRAATSRLNESPSPASSSLKSTVICFKPRRITVAIASANVATEYPPPGTGRFRISSKVSSPTFKCLLSVRRLSSRACSATRWPSLLRETSTSTHSWPAATAAANAGTVLGNGLLTPEASGQCDAPTVPCAHTSGSNGSAQNAAEGPSAGERPPSPSPLVLNLATANNCIPTSPSSVGSLSPRRIAPAPTAAAKEDICALPGSTLWSRSFMRDASRNTVTRLHSASAARVGSVAGMHPRT